jgi:hypothetical protein
MIVCWTVGIASRLSIGVLDRASMLRRTPQSLIVTDAHAFTICHDRRVMMYCQQNDVLFANMFSRAAPRRRDSVIVGDTGPATVQELSL